MTIDCSATLPVQLAYLTKTRACPQTPTASALSTVTGANGAFQSSPFLCHLQIYCQAAPVPADADGHRLCVMTGSQAAAKDPVARGIITDTWPPVLH